MSDQELQQERRQSDEENKRESDEEEKEVPKAKRKRIEQLRLKAEHLTDTKKGVLYLYNLTKDYKFRNDELEELNRYMHVIEEWHYQIMPKYDFDYFTNRLQKIGGNNSIQTHLQFLRKAHKGLIPWQYITNPLEGNLEGNMNAPEINNQSIDVTNNNTIMEDIQPQTDHKEIYENLLQSIPAGVKDLPSCSQRKPMKLSLKKNGSSIKQNLKVRFEDQPQPTPQQQIQQEDEIDDQLFAELEQALKLRAEQQNIQK